MKSFIYKALLIGSLMILQVCSFSLKKKSSGEFEPDWQSLRQFETPEWFRDAKFGIYFHWGVYSVPAYKTEWYSRRMYEPGSQVHRYHVTNYGPVQEFGYKDFIPMFRGEQFNAEEWAQLFRKAGARFAGPVAEHADGFAMWDSKLTRFDATEMGPMIDVVGEMERAVRAEGMKFITTFHHQWLFGWYPTWDKSSGTAEPAYRDLYGPVVPPTAWKPAGENPDPLPDDKFCRRWLSRVEEVIDLYHPDLVYFDSKMHIIDEKTRLKMLSHYYNHALKLGKEVLVTYKQEDLKPWAGVLDLERSRMEKKKEFPWLTDDSVDWGSWCHVSEPSYKSANRIIDYLVDVVSKNGCVLLNVTPTASGVIPEPVRDRLLEIGRWLEINGEAIYSTRPWEVCGEGPSEIIEGHLNERENPDMTISDIRFTCNGEYLYAIILEPPYTTRITIASMNPENGITPETIEQVDMLGSVQPVGWETGEEGTVLIWDRDPELEHALAFRIRLKSKSGRKKTNHQHNSTRPEGSEDAIDPDRISHRFSAISYPQ